MMYEHFSGIGIGTLGSVDIKNGTVIGAYNLNWSKKQEVKKQAEKVTERLFVIENDANVAALGECWKGAGENHADVVFVTLGTGVGGGIIMNDRLLRGVNGCAGEMGHITIDPDGFEGTCGKKVV